MILNREKSCYVAQSFTDKLLWQKSMSSSNWNSSSKNIMMVHLCYPNIWETEEELKAVKMSQAKDQHKHWEVDIGNIVFQCYCLVYTEFIIKGERRKTLFIVNILNIWLPYFANLVLIRQTQCKYSLVLIVVLHGRT